MLLAPPMAEGFVFSAGDMMVPTEGPIAGASGLSSGPQCSDGHLLDWKWAAGMGLELLNTIEVWCRRRKVRCMRGWR